MKIASLPRILLLLAFSTAAHAQLAAPAKIVSITDTRATEQGQSRLEVEIVLPDNVVAGAKSVTPKIKTAVDDTGKDLINRENDLSGLDRMRDHDKPASHFSLTLKSPARKAALIKEISGEAGIYLPKNDPAAVIKVENFQKEGGKKLTAPGLSGLGMEITAWTRAQADAAKTKFGGLFDSSSGPNDILVQVKDPGEKLMDIEFQDAKGNVIVPNGWSTMGESKDVVKTFSFQDPLPADAVMVVYLITERSLVKVPFTVVNAPLP